MPSPRPAEHIDDSQKLIADAEIQLFEIMPRGGTGVIRIKPDNTTTWLGNIYTGMPVQLASKKKQSDSGFSNVRMVIGQENVDLSLLKPFIFDGSLDNAEVTEITLLRSNLEANRNIREEMTWRVKQVEGYSGAQITLVLATYSDSLNFQLPLMAYDHPDFPSVQLT